MSNAPLITVVIPSYNSAYYIEETLHSLAIQTTKDFEVIVIDDQSTDDTFRIAVAAHKKFGLAGEVILRPDHIPKGVSKCRNLGISKAFGKWISFLDSDDLFFPDKIKGTIELIDKYGATCFAYHHATRQFEDGTNKTLSITTKESTTEPKNIFKSLTAKNFITTSSVTIKKSLVDDIGGFDSTLNGVEDYMLWLRAAKRTKWCYSNTVWTDYRVRTTSLMGGREMQYYVEQNKNLLTAIKNTNEFSAEDVTDIERYIFGDVMNYYSTVALSGRGWGDFLKGLKALNKAGKRQLAITLFNKHFKFLLLKRLSLLKKSLTKKQ